MLKSNIKNFQAGTAATIFTKVVTLLLQFRLIQSSVINTMHNATNIKCTLTECSRIGNHTLWFSSLRFQSRVFDRGNLQLSTSNRRNNSAIIPFYVRIQSFFRSLTVHLEYCIYLYSSKIIWVTFCVSIILLIFGYFRSSVVRKWYLV